MGRPGGVRSSNAPSRRKGNLLDLFLTESIATFCSQKSLADGAIGQLSDDQLHARLGDDENSIAILVQHIAGNQVSRWTDFLTTDGEKPDRARDREFEVRGQSRAEILAEWERGWGVLFDTLHSLTAEDLGRTVTIRGEPHTIHRAVLRQVSHYGYHVGQIVQLARHLVGDSWKTLSIARGESDAFNRKMQPDR